MFSESVILYIFSWIQDDFLYISTKFSTDFVDRQKSTLYTNNLLMQSIDTYFLMHCHVWPTYAGDYKVETLLTVVDQRSFCSEK